jgi:hypothetical protein
MSKDEPTIEMDAQGKPVQPGRQEKPTVAAGQEARQPHPAPPSAGNPFQPTSPKPYQAPAKATVTMHADAARVPMAWIAVFEGPSSLVGSVHTLGPETIIGRTTGDLILTGDPSVSGQHIKIKFEAGDDDEQAFVLYDLASSNGTFVGDRDSCENDESRIYRHVLKDGDFILIGQTKLVFKQV